jgi:hypothetical protein
MSRFVLGEINRINDVMAKKIIEVGLKVSFLDNSTQIKLIKTD